MRTRHVAKHQQQQQQHERENIIFILGIKKNHRCGTCDIHNRLKWQWIDRQNYFVQKWRKPTVRKLITENIVRLSRIFFSLSPNTIGNVANSLATAAYNFEVNIHWKWEDLSSFFLFLHFMNVRVFDSQNIAGKLKLKQLKINLSCFVKIQVEWTQMLVARHSPAAQFHLFT